MHSLILLPIVTLLIHLSPVSPAGGFLLPLIPLATITGHGGLYASGLTGAALLKLRAATAIAALAGVTQSGFHFKIGHGWTPDLSNHPPHQSHGGGGWGWHRRRRSVEQVDMGPTLDEVLAHDKLGCGMRLVCELAAGAANGVEIGEDGRGIIGLFSGLSNNEPSTPGGKLTYTTATRLGKNSKDASTCGRIYGKCPWSGGEILGVLRGV